MENNISNINNANKDTTGKINFFLPEFYGNFKQITALYDWMENEPGLFYPDIRIAAAYGCFPGNIWNGGRVILGSATKDEIEYAVKEYNDRDIAVRYTFTNPMLEQWHVLDTYCNLVMQLSDNGKNEVIVNAPVLEEFLRKTYPDFHYISSTTKCLTTMESFNEELEKDYYLVVMDSALNNTEELFNVAHKEKVELIVNHYCKDNCPGRRKHYQAVGSAQLEYTSADYPACPSINRSFSEIKNNRSFISIEDIRGKYRNAGFNNFKLDGRGFKKAKVMESFAYYFALPEYEKEIFERLMKL